MKKMVSLLLSAALLTGVGLPAAQAAAPLADAAYTVRAVDGIVSEEIGNVRVQVLSPTLVRIEEKGPKGYEDRNTFHISNRTDWLGDTVSRTTEGDKIVLTTSRYKIILPQQAQNMSQVVITDLAGNKLWSYSKISTNKVALPDLTEYVSAWAIADTPRIVPPEWGFAEQPADNRDNPDTNGWDLSNNAADYYVFLPAGDHKQLRKDFVNLTGRTEMLSLSALGAWDSRYYAYTEETALAQIDGFHSRNIPLDNLVIDTDWRNASNGTGYDVNTKLFPDMIGFLEKAHEKNVNIIFNDHPTKTGSTKNNALNPIEVAFRQQNLTNILKMGLDGWWYDRNWTTTIVPPSGFTHEVMGMATYAAAQKTVYPDRRLYMMSNIDGVNNGTRTGASNIAAHRYGVQWTGDTGGGQETIWQEVANTIDMGTDSALPYVSTDLGAHQTYDSAMTNAEYLRWMQFGALSPIFRPHVMHVTSFDNGRMPWLRGEETTDIYRDYLNLRYRLLPVFYQLSHENYETGMPLTRSMAFDWPEYAGADTSDQYMLGEDILVAPVIDGSDNGILPADWFTDLQAEYYNNKDLSGEPVLTKALENINFNWGTGSPDSAVQADNFSIRFTGSVTIQKDIPAKLSLICDDGCRLWIDDELVIDAWKPQDSVRRTTPDAYEAGTTHTFKLEYYEGSGNAKVRMSSISEGENSAPRTVWIPEGEWIDTISGKTVYGPQTIQLVCKTDEYPVFIKKGSVIPLADETLTTRDSDWSHLTLDVYPSTRQSDETELYEDDTESTKYEEGQYRTTRLVSSFDQDTKEAIVEIGAAQGSFEGALAFDSRDWTLRIHQPEGWGALQKVLVDGKETAFETIAADSDAMPLVNAGGSRDGAVYAVAITAAVKSGATVRLQFDNPADPAVPSGDYDTPSYYGKPAPVAVDRDIQVEETVPTQVNLTEEGSADWIHAGYDKTMALVRKAGVDSKITFRDVSTPLMMYDYKAHMSWTDGDVKESISGTQTGSHNKGVGDGYEIIVDAGPGEQTLTLYLGGWRSTARMEIYDEAGGEVQSYQWSNSSGSFYRRVTITFKADRPSPLHIRYSLVSGDNNVFVAAALSGEVGQAENALYMNTGSYQSGSWTNKTVKIGLSAAQPDQVEKYQVKENDADWSDLAAGDYRVTKDGIYDLQFRYVGKDGKTSGTESITVKRDGAQPQLSMKKAVNADGTVTLTFSAEDQLSGSALYYAVNGGFWKPLADKSLTLPADDSAIYRFKAVSGTGTDSALLAYTAGEADPDPDPDPDPDIVPGDMDKDNVVTIQDVMEACKVLARKSAGKEPTEDEMARGNLDGDDAFSIGDVMEICKILARKA